jgi:hypothetical protein
MTNENVEKERSMGGVQVAFYEYQNGHELLIFWCGREDLNYGFLSFLRLYVTNRHSH